MGRRGSGLEAGEDPRRGSLDHSPSSLNAASTASTASSEEEEDTMSRCTKEERKAKDEGKGFGNVDKELSEAIGKLTYTDILPLEEKGYEQTRDFLMKVVELLLEYIKETYDRGEGVGAKDDEGHEKNPRRGKILEFLHPDQMQATLDLDVPDQPRTLQELINDCAVTLKHSVKTGHPWFFNQLSCGLDIVSMAGEWLTATANTNMFTYEIAPVFILMENVVMKRMRQIIGDSFSNGDSILAPGGSISNLYAFLAARHRMFPGYKEKGLHSIKGQLVMYTSDQCHYSVRSCAAVCGLGTDNCVEVPSDSRGRMIPSELERLVLERKKRGDIPFFVNATAGTTVLGAFDPIPQIADICAKHKMWLHVDAAWGGGLLFSKKHRHPRMTGIERADSVTWNPHKLMGTLLQCSTIHFKEDGLLISCNQMSAEYLFMQDKLYDVQYDTGDKVIQCGRHNDIFKLWLMWRSKVVVKFRRGVGSSEGSLARDSSQPTPAEADTGSSNCSNQLTSLRGTEGFEKQMDRLMELSDYMVRRMKQSPDKFHLLLPEPELVNVSFWYVPKRLRTMAHGPEREKILGKITPVLKGRMMQAGTLMVGYQPLDDTPNFFRNIISNPGVKESDVDHLMAEMDRLGHDL